MLKPCDLTFFVLSAHHYHDDGVCCCKWCECISNFEIPVWGKNVIVNLLNLSKNLIYNKKSFYATASIASHRTPAELCRFCDALNVHGFNRTQRYSVQFSVQFELTESAQTPYLHLEFFDEQIAFIPFHYAVITMDEWNEWNEFDVK